MMRVELVMELEGREGVSDKVGVDTDNKGDDGRHPGSIGEELIDVGGVGIIEEWDGLTRYGNLLGGMTRTCGTEDCPGTLAVTAPSVVLWMTGSNPTL